MSLIPILGAFVLGYLIDAGWARIVRGVRLERRDYKRFIVGRFRIHHNVLGYVLLLCGLLAYPLFLVPLGLGIIVGHRIRDRLFWFVEVIPRSHEVGHQGKRQDGGPGGQALLRQ